MLCGGGDARAGDRRRSTRGAGVHTFRQRPDRLARERVSARGAGQLDRRARLRRRRLRRAGRPYGQPAQQPGNRLPVHRRHVRARLAAVRRGDARRQHLLLHRPAPELHGLPAGRLGEQRQPREPDESRRRDPARRTVLRALRLGPGRLRRPAGDRHLARRRRAEPDRAVRQHAGQQHDVHVRPAGVQGRVQERRLAEPDRRPGHTSRTRATASATPLRAGRTRATASRSRWNASDGRARARPSRYAATSSSSRPERSSCQSST